MDEIVNLAHGLGYLLGRCQILRNDDAQLSDADFAETMGALRDLALDEADVRDGWAAARREEDGFLRDSYLAAIRECDTTAKRDKVAGILQRYMVALTGPSSSQSTPLAKVLLELVEQLPGYGQPSPSAKRPPRELRLAEYRRAADDGKPVSLTVRELLEHEQIAPRINEHKAEKGRQRLYQREYTTILEDVLERDGLKTDPPLAAPDECDALDDDQSRQPAWRNARVKLVSLDYEITGEETAGPPPPDVIWRTEELAIGDVVKRLVAKGIDLQPFYQRQFVWGSKKVSNLIESLLINVPIPPIYLCEMAEGRLEVIDGQQRLTAIRNFIHDGQISGTSAPAVLRNPRIRKELAGRRFIDFPKQDQEALTSRKLTFIIIKESLADLDATTFFEPNIEVFTRLNQEATPLRPMEMRNALYAGPYMRLLRRLADEDKDTGSFLLSTVVGKNAVRMDREEWLLRLFALWKNGPTNYTNMRTFCDREVRRRRELSPDEQTRFRDALTQGVRLARNVFDPFFGMRFVPGSPTDKPHGSYEPRAVQGLFHVVLAVLMGADEPQVAINKASFREGVLCLVSHDAQFSRALDRYTGKVHLDRLWSSIRTQLDHAVASEPGDEWWHHKLELFKRRVCSHCACPIEDIDDAVPVIDETIDDQVMPFYWLRPYEYSDIQHRGCWNYLHQIHVD